jgi:hypothetical protein
LILRRKFSKLPVNKFHELKRHVLVVFAIESPNEEALVHAFSAEMLRPAPGRDHRPEEDRALGTNRPSIPCLFNGPQALGGKANFATCRVRRQPGIGDGRWSCRLRRPPKPHCRLQMRLWKSDER